MKEGFRQSMAWLHTWSGLIVGWLLLAIFLTGAASYYRSEITGWMHPEIPSGAPVSQSQSLKQAMDWLHDRAPVANSWLIDLPTERLPVAQVMWQAAGERRYNSELLNPASQQPVAPRKTFGGDFFYGFHFQLSLPPIIGRWIVGVASMLMFIAIISGVITHRRIFKDFFTFRPGKGQRSWLDAHNTLSVLALPFHVLITYTGLVTLMFMYVPWGIDLVYGGDRGAYFRDLRDFTPPAAPATEKADLAPYARLNEQARQQWGEGHIARVAIGSPGATNARIELIRDTQDQVSSLPQRLVLNGVSGELIETSDATGPAKAFYGVLYGLHLAHFAEPLLRLLLFISGLGGTIMIATGLQLWVVKRKGNATGGLYRRIEGLNVAVILGLPLAMAGFFWGNRLVPGGLPGREIVEVQVFFAVWLMTILHAQVRSIRRVWREQALLCALAFAGVPLLDLITGPDAVNGLNLFCVLFAGAFAFVLWRLCRSPSGRRSTRATRQIESRS
jgi:uncharacterized iron-regulated membrane protein